MTDTRVLVVDDHQMFADALEVLLRGEPGIAFVGTASSGEAALEVAARECPDVVLMDIDLPGIDGVEATRRIIDLCPEARVVAISALQPDQVLARAVEAGASGFVPKSRAADELVHVIRRAAQGEIVLPEADMSGLLTRLHRAKQGRTDADEILGRLTARELEILQQFAAGRNTEEVASELFLSTHTVNSHLYSVLAKLGVRSKLEAVLFALRHGAIQLSDREPDARPD